MDPSLSFIDECIAARKIIESALTQAIDDALDANISGTCLAAAVLDHICSVLIDQFGHTPDKIGGLAEASAAAYVQASEAKSANH